MMTFNYELKTNMGALVQVSMEEVRRALERELMAKPIGTLFGQPLGVHSALLGEFYKRGGLRAATPQQVHEVFKKALDRSVLISGGRVDRLYTVDLDREVVTSQLRTHTPSSIIGAAVADAVERRCLGTRRRQRRYKSIASQQVRRRGWGRRHDDDRHPYTYLPVERREERERRQALIAHLWRHPCPVLRGEFVLRTSAYCADCGAARSLEFDRRRLDLTPRRAG